MLTEKTNYRGNVVNQKTDEKWYLDFIRNPNISTNAKVVFLNLRTNGNDYKENIKSLMFKCNLSERLVSKALKELECLGIVSKEMKRDSGRFFYIYKTSVENLPSPLHRATVDHGRLTVPYKYKENINKTNDDKENNHHEISDLENVANSVIEFTDKSDSKKANELFDEVIYNSGVFKFPINDSRIANIKLDNIPKAIKKNNLTLVLEVIKMFPEYAKKTNEGLNPKGQFTEFEMLTYLKTILASDCQYPKWFNSLYKQEEVKKEVNSLEQSWKQITEFWDARGSRIDDCIKNMIKMILESIQDFEYHKVNNLSNDKRMIEFFNTATKKTLSKTNIDNFIDLIKEYISKTWLSVDPFQKQINSFNDAGFTLDTIKSYFLSGVN